MLPISINIIIYIVTINSESIDCMYKLASVADPEESFQNEIIFNASRTNSNNL